MKNVVKTLINGNELIWNGEKVCNYCTICIALFVIAFLTIISISANFYFQWYLKKDNTNINTNTETVIS